MNHRLIGTELNEQAFFPLHQPRHEVCAVTSEIEQRSRTVALVFLASEDSNYITGIELFVDGGFAQV